MKPRKPALRATEAQLKRSVVSALQLHLRGNGRVLRMQGGRIVVGSGKSERMIALGTAGTPDLLVILPGGRCVWLELKTATGRLTAIQEAWHAAARILGHSVYVCRSVQDAIAGVRVAMEAT